MTKKYVMNQRSRRTPAHPRAIIHHDILPALKMIIVEPPKQLNISC